MKKTILKPIKFTFPVRGFNFHIIFYVTISEEVLLNGISSKKIK